MYLQCLTVVLIKQHYNEKGEILSMEGITTKILLLVAALFLFVVVVVGVLQPTIASKGDEVKTTITGTKMSK